MMDNKPDDKHEGEEDHGNADEDGEAGVGKGKGANSMEGGEYRINTNFSFRSILHLDLGLGGEKRESNEDFHLKGEGKESGGKSKASSKENQVRIKSLGTCGILSLPRAGTC